MHKGILNKEIKKIMLFWWREISTDQMSTSWGKENKKIQNTAKGEKMSVRHKVFFQWNLYHQCGWMEFQICCLWLRMWRGGSSENPGLAEYPLWISVEGEHAPGVSHKPTEWQLCTWEIFIEHLSARPWAQPWEQEAGRDSINSALLVLRVRWWFETEGEGQACGWHML